MARSSDTVRLSAVVRKLYGKKRRPGDLDARRWQAIAQAVNYRPADVLQRVQELVDSMLAERVAVAEAVASLQGSVRGYVEQAAELIEANALRIAGRLRKAP
ncbi:MAG: hypothetical protein GC187_03555 [Alphaproteobacteria bacterium]|nr:hypothetical protein [Alphaproteobacteria bacterium]